MKFYLRRIPFIFWRVWFVFLALFPVLVLFPLLFVLVLLPNGYPALFWIGRNFWSPIVLFGMGFYLKRIPYHREPISWDKTHMLVANHASYIDIFVMFRMSKKPFVFVGKKELGAIPVFGPIYRRAAILVDRSNAESRKAVYGKVNKVIKKGYSVCIFPERDYMDETILLNPFKRGAFKLAIEHQIPVLPMVFLDCKRKSPWYTTHGYPGQLRVEIHDAIPTQDWNEMDIPAFSKKIYDFIENRLLKDPKQSAVQAIAVWKKRAA